MVSPARIGAAIVDLLDRRSAESSICPSDAARALASSEEEWRALMAPVREVAATLALKGVLRITKGTTELSPDQIEDGPIRLRRGPAWETRRRRQG